MQVNNTDKHNALTHRQTALDSLFDTLVDAGVRDVHIEYSGGHDEGGADAITVTHIDGREETFDAPYRSTTSYVRELAPLPAWLYSSFAGEFRVSGEIFLDVSGRTVTVEGAESTYHTESVYHDTTAFLQRVSEKDAWLAEIRRALSCPLASSEDADPGVRSLLAETD